LSPGLVSSAEILLPDKYMNLAPYRLNQSLFNSSLVLWHTTLGGLTFCGMAFAISMVSLAMEFSAMPISNSVVERPPSLPAEDYRESESVLGVEALGTYSAGLLFLHAISPHPGKVLIHIVFILAGCAVDQLNSILQQAPYARVRHTTADVIQGRLDAAAHTAVANDAASLRVGEGEHR
jgi:hypothetical protein